MPPVDTSVGAAQALINALNPSRRAWRQVCREFPNASCLEDMVGVTLSEPLFKYTYGWITGIADPFAMSTDVKSGVAMLANNLLSPSEIATFVQADLFHHLQTGLAISARALRDRTHQIPVERFVSTARVTTFTCVLKLVTDDLQSPMCTLTWLLDQLDLSGDERMSLLQMTMTNYRLFRPTVLVHH